MAYFNHAFTKVFLGTHASQTATPGVDAGVDQGFLTDDGIHSVNLVSTAAPYALGIGVFGLFDPNTYLSVDAGSASLLAGAPLVLASTALYQHDKVGPFHGGYQESTKSKMINPKYVSRFYRVDPCTPNQNVVHVGNTPYTSTLSPADSTCCAEFLCDETYFLRIDVKGSPALRTLSRNAYWTADYYTGCCPANTLVPTPVDSTLVFIGWANQALANPIVGPYLNIVVYDEAGNAWYAPGDPTLHGYNIDLSPGIGTVTIVNAGSGYVNGTFYNVPFNTNGTGTGATATVTVAGGVVTAVTITSHGMSYAVGDTLTTNGGISAGTGASFLVATTITPTWDNYVSPGHVTDACAGFTITGAYVDTKFGDCTFYPNDYFEKEPVKILPSEVDETGDPCAFTGVCVIEECCPRQGNGFGETVLRDLILSESYMQNYFNTNLDLRIREVTQGYDISSAINRSALYYRYFILHSVPRFNNPTGVFDNDQYMLEIITNAPSTTFETTMATWLTACTCSASLETMACGDPCPAVVG